MFNDTRYKEDQIVFRGWIQKLEDALLNLEAKLEDKGAILTPTQALPQDPSTTNLPVIVPQNWGNIHAQFINQYAESQKEMVKQWSDAKIQITKTLAEAIYSLRQT